MKVEDLRPRGAGWTIRLHEKGGKQHAMPCHHALAEALHAYINAASIAEDRKGFLFRTARGHKGTVLSDKAMSQPDAWRMIRRRAASAGIAGNDEAWLAIAPIPIYGGVQFEAGFGPVRLPDLPYEPDTWIVTYLSRIFRQLKAKSEEA
jgi:integrase